MTRPGAAPVRLLTITAPAVGVVRANSRFAFDANRQGDLNRPSLRFGLVLVRHVAREAQGDRSPSGRRENNDRSPTPEQLQSPHCWTSQQWHPQSRREERDQRLEEPRWRRMFGGATPTLPRWRFGLVSVRRIARGAAPGGRCQEPPSTTCKALDRRKLGGSRHRPRNDSRPLVGRPEGLTSTEGPVYRGASVARTASRVVEGHQYFSMCWTTSSVPASCATCGGSFGSYIVSVRSRINSVRIPQRVI